MLNMPLSPGAPWSVTIAADPRLTATDYADDTAYTLAAAGGPLGLFTAFGGRCDGMLWDILWRSPTLGIAYGVEEYAATPLLRSYGPGYALLDLLPFDGLPVRAACIAHSSHAAVCYFTIANATSAPVEIILTNGLRLQLATPLPDAPEPASAFLRQETGDRRQETRDHVQPILRLASPVSGLSSGAQVAFPNMRLAMMWDEPGQFDSDPFPDGRGWTIWRHRELRLAPGEERSVWFALVTAKRSNELTTRARDLLATDWAVELLRHEELAAQIPVIETGNAEWDAAIASTYRLAARCYLSGSGDPTPGNEQQAANGRPADIHNSGSGFPPLPYPSFVFARSPERGFPPDGDPENHSWMWNGQVATEAYVNVPQVAPFAPDLAKAVLRNYLYIQHPNGFIDWKPGLAGQRAGWDCLPLLAPLARMIYDYTGDIDFLEEVYRPLVHHLDRWFVADNDRDGDGFPEWLHTIQSAFDDNPTFVPFRPWAQGADVSKAEGPDLGAYLYREHIELISIAELLQSIKLQVPSGRQEAHLISDTDRLRTRAEHLRAEIESLWNEERAIYSYRDRDTHLSHDGAFICELVSSSDKVIRWQGDTVTSSVPDHPVTPSPRDPLTETARRIVIRVEAAESPDIHVLLRGIGDDGTERTEVLLREHFGWWGKPPYVVSATTTETYRHLSHIEVSGIEGRYLVRARFVDYTREDQTLLLPLWAGIPDKARAEALVRRTLTDPQRFWRPYGIPNCSAQDPAYRSDNRNGSGGVWMMWNTMLGEGLCDYGFFAEAWELFGRIVAAQLRSLRDEQCFREAYDSDTGEGLGARDYLWGTVPLHFLTKLHGIIVVAHDHVRLLPADLGGRRITVHYHGVTVARYESGATIIWPNGRREQVALMGAQIVERWG